MTSLRIVEVEPLSDYSDKGNKGEAGARVGSSVSNEIISGGAEQHAVPWIKLIELSTTEFRAKTAQNILM